MAAGQPSPARSVRHQRSRRPKHRDPQYGSIGAVIILMTWLYLSVWAILVGGAINAELESRARVNRLMGRAKD